MSDKTPHPHAEFISRAIEDLPLPSQVWWGKHGWSESEVLIAADAILYYLRDLREGKL